MVGMMPMLDGSTHRRIVALGHDIGPIVAMDDAAGWICSAFFVDPEGTMAAFRELHETISAHGLFGSFQIDRSSHYFYTPVAGRRVDKKQLTQVGPALKPSGIRHIPSYTPEGRGRPERVSQPAQQRLPPSLRKSSGVRAKISRWAAVGLRWSTLPLRLQCEKSSDR